MKNERLLVTGASGFIGQYVVEALHKEGYHIAALYRKIPCENLDWECVEGDLLEPTILDLLGKMRLDFIVHCASVVPKQFEGKEAERAAGFNRLMDDQVLDLCKRQAIRLIYLSSTSIYGLTPRSVCSEEAPTAPIGPYAAAKFYTEKRIYEELDLEAASLRVSAPYGPGQRNKTVLRLFIERALVGANLTYHGSGNRTQDFTYIKDVADAIVCAVGARVKGIYNIAGGYPISMCKLAKLVVTCVSGCTSQVVPSTQSDPQEDYRARFDICKAKRILGWQPRTRLEEGITEWIFALRSEG
ncbi:MAG: NAD-dependent epimerase/dehydratase family protein [Thermodesulfobacteriota bacterium]